MLTKVANLGKPHRANWALKLRKTTQYSCPPTGDCMTNLVFIAKASGNDQSGYTAQFCDFGSCRGEGATLAALITDLRRALREQLATLERNGDAWPDPTPLAGVTADTGSFLIPIDVSVDDTPIRVNISMGERLVQRLDAEAERRGTTRSGFIAQSVKVSLGETNSAAPQVDALGRRLHDELAGLDRRINEAIGPNSEFARRMNKLDDTVLKAVQKTADRVSAAVARRRETATADARLDENNK